ncbi:MAG: amino acid adenylation domain-containing protein, partial [bacterium]|nr:amino acid adenylation domain-containing protein [bacterium]
MNLVPLLSKLKSSGVTIRLEDENLKIKARDGALTPELVKQLKERKREIIEFLRQTGKSGEMDIHPVEKKDYYPLSSPQERLYFLHQLEPGNVAYNMVESVPLAGKIDVERFQSVFLQLVHRHESFRTSFHTVDQAPVQRIHDNVDFQVDFSGMDVPVKSLSVSRFLQYFDLSKAPLLRATVIRTGERHYWLVVDMHHIISDGTSMAILTGEFLTLVGGGELEPLRLRYRDYVHWQRSAQQQERLKKEETYWLGRYAGELPQLLLPTDYPRPRNRVYYGYEVGFNPAPRDVHRLRDLARQEGATLYMTTLSLFYVLMSKLSGLEDIISGAALAGRRHADLESIVGMFVNTLALRNFPAGGKTFTAFLREVKEDTGKAFQNQQYPFDELVDRLSLPRDLGRNPIFDVLFNMVTQEQNSINTAWAGKITRNKHYESVAKFDIMFTLVEAGDSLLFKFEYCSALFKKETIDRMISYFDQILKEVTANPDVRLSEIQWLTEAEKHQVLIQWNDTSRDYPRDRTLHQLFEEQVERTPDRIAPAFNHHALSYRQLDHWADGLAGELRKKGVSPDSIVALKLERSLDMIAAILGILKAGGAYLPIDPVYPEERIEFMLKDSGAKIIVTNGLKVDRLGGSSEPTNQQTNQPTNLAYIIYTSGSTGHPKGVAVEHASLVNLVFSQTRRFGIDENDRVLQFSSVSFDASVEQVFISLCSGAVLVLVDRDTLLDRDGFSEFLLRRSITHLHAVPSFLDTIDVARIPSLKRVIAGGDICPPSLAQRLRRPGRCEFYNEYGPTETTVTSLEIMAGDDVETLKRMPIGKPIPNTVVYLLDKWQKPVPTGVVGEIYIGGHGVARGYLNRPQLTAERFILSNARLYRTGDLGRWLPDGNIDFLGRADHQVKIRGYRIELEEIEKRLALHRQVKDAVVIARNGGDDEKYMCAYYVPVQGDITAPGEDRPEPGELKTFLALGLPDYMIPSFFVELDNIPLTPSGKTDREALPEPGMENRQGDSFLAPRTVIEEKLAGIWGGVLKINGGSIGIDANFFDLGGHSLKATVLTSMIHKEMEVKVPISEVFRSPTIKSLAKYIRGTRKEKYAAIDPVEEREYYELSSAQRRVYFLQQVDPGGSAYNMPFAFPLGRGFEIPKLELTLKHLIKRHESLRTSFEKVRDRVVQRVHDGVDVETRHYEADRPVAGILKDFVRPFDLSRPPLIRSGIVHREKENYTWLVDIHHIVSDGTSTNVLIEDFIAMYQGESLQPLRLQYKDFSQWQNRLLRSRAIKLQEQYWLERFADVRDIPPLQLPSDYKRPAVFRYDGSHCLYTLNPDDIVNLRAIGASSGSTLYMDIMAVLNTLFYKYTGQTDIVIGSGIAGRKHADLQRIIGMFVNTLAIRSNPHGEKTYGSFLKEVIRSSVDSFENQDVQFEELVDKLQVERDPSRNPLFDVTMVVQNFQRAGESAPVEPRKPGGNSKQARKEIRKEDPTEDGTVSQGDYTNRTAKFDLTFFVHELENGVYISLEYYTSLFKETSIKRLISHFKNLIKAVIADPGLKLKDIDILSQEERQKVLEDFNDTQTPYPSDQTIHELFDRQATAHAGKVALAGAGDTGGLSTVAKQQHLTYDFLNRNAGRLANYLYHERGVRPERPVAILMDNSPSLVTAILGILKAGGAYLPLEPSLPEERMIKMIDDAGVEIILSQKRFIRRLNRLQWECSRLSAFLCMDSWNVYDEEEEEQSGLMDLGLWEYIGKSATDDITGGGWLTSYTGEPFTREEMDEYGDNALKKLMPLVTGENRKPGLRVLEIGCASGLTMYRVAPLVDYYCGTDLSEVIIEKNRQKVKEEGHRNISLHCLAAHQIDTLEEEPFDLIIINSVIQSFHGHNYLRRLMFKIVDLMSDGGHLFIGDVMDQDRKEALVRDLRQFKQAHRGEGYTTKSDLSAELFVSPSFFKDLALDIPAIQSVDISHKIYTIENELTRFRYDALLTLRKNRKGSASPRRQSKRSRHKYQHDLRVLDSIDTGPVPSAIKPGNLAYIIYTSGSTGGPKGVMVEHGNVVSFVKNVDYIEFREDQRLMMAGSIAFDITTLEIWGALLNGLSLYLIPRDVILDAEQLRDALIRESITVFHLIPQLLSQVLDRCPEAFEGLEYFFVGGDLVLPGLVNRLQHINPHLKIIHSYGPTENTTFSTTLPVDRQYIDRLPIGSPISNSTVYILDTYGNPQPIGVPGELCTGGDGVTRGYLNNPELSSEKFLGVQNPFFKKGFGCRRHGIYHTGDLARWLADGVIEFLGRIDHQVKLRGMRIETGEIESRLLAHDDIDEAVVVMRDDGQGDGYLCAYVVSGSADDLDTGELSDFLKTLLPEYMVPAHFVLLESLPLTYSGKVNPNALPLPKSEAAVDGSAPRNRLERQLLDIWVGVLGIEQSAIGIDSDFFRLGGHSLKATVLTARIHKEMEVKVPLAEIFTHRTIRALASYIGNTGPDRHKPIERAEEKEYYPLSAAQKRMYILQQMETGNTRYNMLFTFPLAAGFDMDGLKSNFDRLIDRHESLRTSFHMVGDRPVQKIHPQVNLKINRYDTVKNIKEEFTGTFDLTKAPLLRVAVMGNPESGVVLLCETHHIISDGSSQEILEAEFALFSQGKEPEPLKLRYRDYSQWQNSAEQQAIMKDQEQFWLSQFPGELPVLNLPLDFPRPKMQGFEGRRLSFYIDKENTAHLKELGRETQTTLYMALLTVFNVLLSKLGGGEDIIVGTPVAGRRHADLQDIIGLFVNTLSMRNVPTQNKRFPELLNEVKQRTLEAYDNQEYQFEDLVEKVSVVRDTGRNPVFDVMFNFLNLAVDRFETGETDLEAVKDAGESKANFDLTFQGSEAEGAIHFSVIYCTALFKEETVRRFIGYFKKILTEIHENPAQELAGMDIISHEEKERLISGFNRIDTNHPVNKTLHGLFQEQVNRAGDNTALAGHPETDEAPHLTYSQLNENANQLARLLMEKGIGPDSIVAVMSNRSKEMIIALLGILESGGAYLPIDPDYPRERIDFMLKDSGAKVIVTNGLMVDHLDGVRVQRSDSSGRPAGNPANLAYIIYTSGSTGKPKGVMVEHRNVTAFHHNLVTSFSISSTQVVYALTTYTFDISVLELICSFLAGATVVLEPAIEDAQAIGRNILRHNVTVLQVTPTRLSTLIESLGTEFLFGLNVLIVGGEALPQQLWDTLRQLPVPHIHNIYGPTETTIWSTTKRLDNPQPSIGSPLVNEAVYILSPAFQLVPIGVSGQLFIAGPGVSRGYLNRPHLTAERFTKGVPPAAKTLFGKSPSRTGSIGWGCYPLLDSQKLLSKARWYRTGDMGRWLTDGNIEFLGRLDQQVKVRGFRIELGEIEFQLAAMDEVKETVVVARDARNGEKYLCAYIVPVQGDVVPVNHVDNSKLKERLAQTLPLYMVPSYFVELENIPLTSSGKTDRRSLPEPGLQTRDNYVAPRNPMDRQLVDIWWEVLALSSDKEQPRIGIQDNFFRLGGHSLRGTVLVSKIHRAFHVNIPLAQLFATPTIRGLSNYIDQARQEHYASIEAAEKKDYYPLSPAQKRLYILQQMEAGHIGYNMPRFFPLAIADSMDMESGKPMMPFKHLLARHESFRTSFFLVDDQPVQQVHDHVEFEIEYYGRGDPLWSPLDGNKASNKDSHGGLPLQTLQDFVRPFDLSVAPLLRVALIKTGDTNYLMAVDMHHIISDGISHDILEREWMTLFSGQPLPDLELQYKDYCLWLFSDRQQTLIKAQESYWLQQFPIHDEIPVLTLPIDFPRPPVQRFDGNSVGFVLSPEETHGLFTPVKTANATLYMTLLAVFNVLLSKIGGQQDIVVGSPVSARRHADLQGIIGMFVNTLALRNRPSGEKTFGQLLQEVKKETTQAFDNQDYPFEELVDHLSIPRDTGRNPLFDVMFNLLNPSDEPGQQTSVDEPGSSVYTHRKAASKFDLTLTAVQKGGHVNFNINYSTNLFKPVTVERLITYFRRLSALLPMNPDQPLSEIELMTEPEKQQILHDFNDTRAEYPEDKTFHRLFEDRVEQSAHRVAVVAPGNRWITYAALDRDANRLARVIREKNIGTGEIAAISANPSIRMITAIMAVLKTGNCYLPLDPMNPEARLSHMLADSETKLLLMETPLPDEVVFEGEVLNIKNRELYHDDEDNDTVIAKTGSPDDNAYMIYTSGTTGKPKGVQVTHGNLVNYGVWFSTVAGLTEEDRSLLTSSFAFDLGYTSLYPSLMKGGQLHVIPKESYMFSGTLLEYILRHRISYLKLTPSLFSPVVDDDDFTVDVCKYLRLVVLGGEAIRVEDVEAAYRRCSHLKLMNHYGPTEVTVGSIARFIEIDELDVYKARPTIGKPIFNTQVYILDKYSMLLPVGIAGELYLSGAGVAAGYFKQPSLTSGKFISIEKFFGGSRGAPVTDGFYRAPALRGQKSPPGRRRHPLAGGPNRIYRTGDLARWLEDGDVEFLGRVDQQVKIRGYRIELGEIENQLLEMDGITDAAVVTGNEKSNEATIRAYFVGNDSIDGEGLREPLGRILPDYMIPSYFLQLERIPLTPNGKLDRGALPEPGARLETRYVAPANHIQRQLSGIWLEVLGRDVETDKDGIGIDDNFFQLGGHSLRATVMISRIHKLLEVKLPLTEVFANPTIRGLDRLIRGFEKSKYSAVEAVEKKDYYVLSPAQKRLYVLHQLGPGSTSYNMPRYYPLPSTETMDGQRKTLLSAFQQLIARHETFRMSFHLVKDEPVQRVHNEVAFEIESRAFDGSTLNRADGYEGIVESFVRPFDLASAPLLRVALIELGGSNRLMAVDMHHIICDAVSHEILEREWKTVIAGNPLPGLRLQYKDYSVWLAGKDRQNRIDEQESYWLERYSGDDEIPVLNLPVDFPRPLVQRFDGNSVGFVLSPDETQGLYTPVRTANTTLYMTVLAVFNVLLSKLTGQEDIIVGSPISSRWHADLQVIIGMFVNTLALRNQPSGEKTFGQLLQEVKEETTQAFDNQEYPFEELVDQLSIPRDTGRNPLFDVLFNLLNPSDEPGQQADVDGPGSSVYTHRKGTSKFDLTLTAVQKEEQVSFNISYSTHLFKPATVERLITYFRRLSVLLPMNPDQPLSEIELITEPEKQQILYDFNDTRAEYPEDKTFHRLFEEQVERTADRVVVVAPGNRWITYGALDRDTNRLARVIQGKSIGTGEIVAITANPSIEMMIAILAVLKTGNCYLPLDPLNPEGRLSYMLADSETKLLLMETPLPDGVVFEGEVLNIKYRDLYHGDDSVVAGGTGSPGDSVYMIYTSGTTGKPKGVQVTHESLVNYGTWFSTVAGLTEEDRSLLTSSFAFDLGYTSLYPSLMKGGQLHVISKESYMFTGTLLEYILRHRISYLKLTPSLFSPIVDDDDFTVDTCKYLRLVVLGGEAIRVEDVETAYLRCSHLKLMNHYGPTEVTIGSIARFIENDDFDIYKVRPTIGKPIFNTQVYILDKYFMLLPVGITGELYLRGAGVAKGYFKQSSLTSEKFISSEKFCGGPGGGFSKEPPGRRRQGVYRTGDLARWLEDGDVEFLGRVDHQVKIRGYRIELGEIESQLLEMDGITGAAVVTGNDISNETAIRAYFVGNGGTDAAGLREELGRILPDYMIPSYFLQLETIPLTPNGKLDRRALPEPGSRLETRYVAPGNRIQGQLETIWQEILNPHRESEFPAIGIDDDFFQLGGHSLRATVLVSRIHKRLEVKLSLLDVFQNPSIRGLAGCIEGMEKSKYEAIEPVEKREYYPVSSAQKRLYFLQQLDPRSTGYNMPRFHPMGKNMDPLRLETTLKKLMARHESLRTSFDQVDNAPVQRVYDEVELDIQYYDLAANRADGGEEDSYVGIVAGFVRPFDLGQSPLFRSGMIKHPGGDFTWLVDIHHIISDGISAGVLTEDFLALYSGRRLPEMTLHYKDFSQWQNRLFETAYVKTQEDYWLDLFADDVPRLELPIDYKRPGVFNFAGDRFPFAIEGEDVVAFRRLGTRNGSTLYMNILAALNTLFYKYTGQTDIVVGTGVAGRPHEDLQQVIGMFINTLAIRNHPQGDKSYETFLKEVASGSVQAFENQDLQFEELVGKLQLERDTSRNPLFDVLMVVQNFQGPAENYRQGVRDVRFERLPAPTEQLPAVRHKHVNSKFDMSFFVVEEGDRLSVSMEYYTSIFKRETILRFVQHFKNVIKGVIADPSIPLEALDILSEPERQALLDRFNDTATDYPRDKTIGQLFRDQVRQTPDHTAVVFGAECLSYSHLDERSNQLANYLYHDTGIRPNRTAGLLMDRSLEMMVAILGVLKSGGAYVPLSPSFPGERIKTMMDDAGSRVLIGQDHHIREINPVLEKCENLESILHIDNEGFFPGRGESCVRPTHTGNGNQFSIEPQPGNLAYIIYTSGSTGQPKGNLTTHYNVTRVVKTTNYIDFRPSDRVLQLSDYAFDGSVFDIYGALLNGSALVMIRQEDLLELEVLAALIKREGIGIFFVTTALFNTLVDIGPYYLTGIRKVLFGGERVSTEHAAKAVEYLGKDRVIHVYGPTEATVYATYYPIDEVVSNQLTIPIGSPIANTTVYVLDSLLNLVPIGVNGEIYIGGPGVCRGYLNNAALTAEKFLPNPFGTGDILYRTGDLGRWLEDGSVQFNGRIDHQVKVRGYRVEPGEIESRLLHYDGIVECKVTAREDRMGSRYLCAYLVPAETINVLDVKEHLSRVLPDFMVPAYFVPLEKFPLNASGKIDQSKLPDPLLSLDEVVEPPRDDLEMQLVHTWSEVLGVNESLIGRDSNFFQLGGHSLKATTLASALHKALNVKVPLVEIFSRQTVKELARFIREAATHRHAAIEPVEKREYYPLSSAQMRLYILQQMDIEGTVYNIPAFIPLPVEPDTRRLEEAFNKLILRHESLRTSFHVMGDRRQVQRVHDEAVLEIGYFNTRLHSSVLKDFIRPFDLSRAPLMRVMVIDGGNSRYLLMVDIHHIVSDGVSQGVLEKDFMALYSGETFPPLRLQYKDFSGWRAGQQENEDFIKQETFWLEQFDTQTRGDIPVLSLPLDFSRPQVQRFEGNTVNFQLSAEDTGMLKAVASGTGTTLFMVLLSITSILLSKLSGQEDIVIGTPIAARRHADLEKIIGMFVNTLALRNYPQGEISVEDFLKQVKECTLGAFEHQEYPFEDLVEKVEITRDMSRNPVFDVILNMGNFDWLEDSYIAGPAGNDAAASSDRAGEEGRGDRTAKFDLSFNFRESGGKLAGRLNYCSHLFNRETIQRFTGYFKEIVSSGFRDLTLELSQIQIITAEEQQRLMEEFNRTGADYPTGKTVLDLFEEQVERT